MELTDQERRLIALLRLLYCADVHLHVERGVLSVRSRVEQSVHLDRLLAGQFAELEQTVDKPH